MVGRSSREGRLPGAQGEPVSDHEEEGEILMGRWDCGSCGQRGVLGDAYECSGCGAPRPDDVEFYLPDDAEVITDAEGIAAAEAGPDWQCAFCDSWMPATDQACNNCGSSFADSERRQKTGEVPDAAAPTVVLAAKPVPEAPRARSRIAAAAAPRTQAPSMGCLVPWKPIAAVIALLFSCFCFYGIYLSSQRAKHDERIAAQRKVVEQERVPLQAALDRLAAAEGDVRRAREALAQAETDVVTAERAVASTEQSLDRHQRQAQRVTVTDHTWSVSLRLEECGADAHEGWEHPRHAFDVVAKQKVHHTERVVDRVETRTQDGYDTESYTERVKTGTRKVQAGTTTKNLGNGRFKRVPKYRTEAVYERVRKTRKVPRMVWKTRQVPYKETIYRDDPVYKPWYTYKTWVWRPTRGLERSGTGRRILDPEGAPPQRTAEALGAKRTVERRVSLGLRLRHDGGSESQRSVDRGRWDVFAAGDPGRVVGQRLLTPKEHAAAIARLQRELEAARARIAPLEAKVPPLEAKVPPLEAKVPPLREAVRPLQQRVDAELAKLRQLEAARP
jgi:hypothetical protein